MTLRDQDSGPIGSPDGSKPIVGDEGLEMLQEESQLLVRTGVESDQRDYDIDGQSITDAEDATLADPEDIGSTTELSGILTSNEGEPFSIAVVWQAKDNTTELARQEFGSDTRFEIPSLKVKSDHAVVVATDESDSGTPNTLTGTLNFH